ncbi:MAG: homoserine dehydrogenase [Candidatus Omnitrophica bacterium]|nr:homoserine dehydrogenase [Candidatus Omnitrophota bacterium]MBU4478142.1 homoserine dehydrogenase [Candidatus Omnitrophota bacterium]MCG2704061.1 homoserine dehydrogenase [Candidatus Omnitrophota bacterium]
MSKIVNIGLIGFGTIGAGVIKVLTKKAALLEKKIGVRLLLKKICDLDISRRRDVSVDKNILTKDASWILNDENINIVVELIGGIHPAKEIILRALRSKKHVVTANKALLAEEGEEIFKTAAENGVDVCFEASVGGGIPIIKALREGFVANRIESIYGIINGTSNYILTQMSDKGCDFKSALFAARQKGYAEKNPTLDIDGIDSAHKIAILARMCFNQPICFKDVYVEGIRDIDGSDLQYADELGFAVKLLAVTKCGGPDLQIRVHPALVPKSHLLAHVDGVLNAIFVNADLVGEALFYGQGAGQLPTASAVVSDLVALAGKITTQDHNVCLGIGQDKRHCVIRAIDDIESRYYLRLSALDKPAVLSQISTILGKYGISIHSVIQKGRRRAEAVPIVMMTHEAKGKKLRQALAKIDKLAVVKKKTVAIRVERL